MKTSNVKIKIGGSSKPPADLHEAARKSLGDKYEAFIQKYGAGFTAQQLVQFVENQ